LDLAAACAAATKYDIFAAGAITPNRAYATIQSPQLRFGFKGLSKHGISCSK
jgi:hypothetical protein